MEIVNRPIAFYNDIEVKVGQTVGEKVWVSYWDDEDNYHLQQVDTKEIEVTSFAVLI